MGIGMTDAGRAATLVIPTKVGISNRSEASIRISSNDLVP
jgi:hypothetical protein